MKILVVSHDAGGANILSSLIKKYRHDFEWLTCVSGPAKNIFPKRIGKSLPISPNPKADELNRIIKSLKPDLILTGTSWGSDIEIKFIKSAKKNKIKTVSFLDHWGKFRERFGYPKSWRENLPDFIFVGDKWAYKIALENGFHKNILFQVENSYLEEMIKQEKKFKQKKRSKKTGEKRKLLYLSGAIYESYVKKGDQANHWTNIEYKSVEDLLKLLKQLSTKSMLELKIRLHPAEKIDKYSNLLRNKNYTGIRKFISVSIPATNSLVKDCLWADVVIGSASMALFIAFIIGRRAISYMPNKRQKFTMPQKGIKEIYFPENLLRGIKMLKKKDYPNIRKEHYLGKNLFADVVHKLFKKS